jgi:hypothetical protein
MNEVTVVGAYHNYLADGKLRRDLVVVPAGGPEGFFFAAHPVLPGQPMPLLSGRFFSQNGEFLLEMRENDLIDNPYGFSILQTRGGWALMDTSLRAILSAEVRSFENSYLTVLRGLLHDPSGQQVVHGDDRGLHIISSLYKIKSLEDA